jgi:integrase
MKAAVDAGLIATSPCRGIKLPRVQRQVQRFPTPDEVERLANAVHPNYEALVYSAVYLGCHWGELVGLRRENLDLLRRKSTS